MDKNVYVLHEYGSNSHYNALKQLCDDNGFELVFREFRVIHLIGSGIEHKKLQRILKQFVNFAFLFNLTFTKGKKVVLGMHPYDWRLPILNFILRNHTVYYHTSFTLWHPKETKEYANTSIRKQERIKKYEFTRKVYTFLDMPVENIMRDYTSFDLIRIETKDKFMNIIKAEINPTVIIGNPPYQDTAVGEQKTFNGPIYNLFIDSVYPISNTVELIHPARFLSNAGGTPKAWNRKILEDSHFRVLLYKENVQDVFEGLQLTGGIAVSMHENDKSNEPIGQFIPFPELKCIGQTVTQSEKFEPLSNIAVSRTAYRFTDLMHKEHPEALSQLSNGHPYDVSTNIFARLPQIFLTLAQKIITFVII